MAVPDALMPNQSPSGFIPDKSAIVGCAKCIVAHLSNPDFDWRANPTPGEQFDTMRLFAESKGWGYSVEHAQAYFICPACLNKSAEAMERELPRFNPHSKCAACGHDKVGTKFCNGLRQDCELGAPRRHLHRLCRRCSFTWIEGCLDDPTTKGKQDGRAVQDLRSR